MFESQPSLQPLSSDQLTPPGINPATYFSPISRVLLVPSVIFAIVVGRGKLVYNVLVSLFQAERTIMPS